MQIADSGVSVPHPNLWFQSVYYPQFLTMEQIPYLNMCKIFYDDLFLCP